MGEQLVVKAIGVEELNEELVEVEDGWRDGWKDRSGGYAREDRSGGYGREDEDRRKSRMNYSFNVFSENLHIKQ